MELERVLAEPNGTETTRAVAMAYDANERDLYSFAIATTREPAAAEDLVQEAFLRLTREARTGRFPDDPRAWLYRVVINLARSRGRRRVVADRLRRLFVERDVARSPEDAYLAREAGAAMATALAHLPAEARMALLLAADGYAGHEVAALIGRTDGATRNLLWRGRRELRARIESETDE